MTLQEAIDTLEGYDFQGVEPEVLQALSVVLLSARTRSRAPELNDVGNRVVETTVD